MPTAIRFQALNRWLPVTGHCEPGRPGATTRLCHSTGHPSRCRDAGGVGLGIACAGHYAWCVTLDQLTTTTRKGLPVIMAPFVPAEAGRVFELCQDKEIQRWTTVPSPYPRGAADQFVEEYTPPAWREVADGRFSSQKAGTELVWGVRVGGDSPLTGLWGSLGLKRHGNGAVEIGWWLGAAVRGRGIMRAAVEKVVEAAFDPAFVIRASVVQWFALVGNVPSAAIAQRTGFRFTGTCDHATGRCWSAVIEPGDVIGPRDDWPDLV